MVDHNAAFYERTWLRSKLKPAWPILNDGTRLSVAALADAAIVEAGQPVPPEPPIPPEPGPPGPSEGWTPYDPTDGSGWAKASTTAQLATAMAVAHTGGGRGIALERGKVYTIGLGRWSRSGTAAQPFIIGAFGDKALPRPVLLVSSGDGISTMGAPAVSHVWLMDLDFRAAHAGHPDCNGLSLLSADEDWLIEGCAFTGFGGNRIQNSPGGPSGRTRNIRIRRTQFLDSYLGQGLYLHGCDSVLLDGCLFDRNGWKAGVTAPNTLNHGLYVQTGCTGIELRDCGFCFSSSHGSQMRSGGKVTRCAYWRNPINLLMGGGAPPWPDGIEALVTDCAFIEATDINPNDDTLTRGFNLDLHNILRGEVTGNVGARNMGSNPARRSLNINATSNQGVHNTPIHDNVWHKAGPIVIEGSPAQLSGTTVTDVVDDDPAHFVDAARTVPADWLAKARKGWTPETDPGALCDWLRAGFARKP